MENEARVVGNYYRDLIRSYGVDCVYRKLDTSSFGDFSLDIDRNVLLKHAYGVDQEPDYSLSAHVLSYVEVENDIFQLNKFGLNPNQDVNFYFESGDFAAALATKAGRYREIPVDETEIACEVPAFDGKCVETVDPDGTKRKVYLSSSVFPYQLGLGYQEEWSAGAGLVSGKLFAEISGYELGIEQTVACYPYEHCSFAVEWDSNSDLRSSLKRKIESDEYVETMLMLTFRVDEVESVSLRGKKQKKYVLSGKLHGSVLFFDVEQLGKYAELVHPEVGDVVEIDFPDENQRERYEIVDCFDKQLTQDGISPLLHKYVWKCKGRRRQDIAGEELPDTEAGKQLDEKHQFQDRVQEEVAKKISMYPENEDAVYGGYELDPATRPNWDAEDVRNVEHAEHESIDPGQLLDVHVFGDGSKLATDGYELVFVAKSGEATSVVPSGRPLASGKALFESGSKWLKASREQIVFSDVAGQTAVLASTEEPGERLSLETLFSRTVDKSGSSLNEIGDSFYKFGSCQSKLVSDGSSLYAFLEAAPGRSFKLA